MQLTPELQKAIVWALALIAVTLLVALGKLGSKEFEFVIVAMVGNLVAAKVQQKVDGK